jgi:long-chain acyl-CoA synthetase
MVPAYELAGRDPLQCRARRRRCAAAQAVDTGPEDIAFLQYTGGTTGVSKGAILLHRNVLANMEQVSAWFGPVRDDNDPQ